MVTAFSMLKLSEAAIQRCSVKKVFLETLQNSQENTCIRASFLIKLKALAQQETLAKVFSYEFCEISKNTYFTEHLWTTASVNQAKPWKKLCKNYHKYTKTIYNDKKTFIVSWMSTHLTKHHLFFHEAYKHLPT